MIRIATVATSALIALSLVGLPLIAAPASAQQRGGVQISGNATVIGLANNAVNAATGFLAKADQNVGAIKGDVKIDGNATVIGLANNAVNAATGFLSKACQNVGVVSSDTGCE
jgi:fructose-specific component phosphotransferase system IIB-like protein